MVIATAVMSDNCKADFTNDRKQQNNSQESPEKVQSKRSKPNSEPSDTIDVVTLPSTDENPNRGQNQQDGKLPLWVAGSSPAKFLTLEELVKISDSIEKMTLVHEMAVDPTFNVQRAQKKDELYEFVKDNVHRAYWDTLEEDMTKDPPDYTFAFQMLKDLNSILKRQFDALNLQNVLSLINEILDMEKLETQYKNQQLDFHKVLRLILDVLRRLCAPAYDEMVHQLNTEKNLAKLFSGTFKLVDYMEKDVISIIITQNRKAIMKYSAEYERDKFMEALKVDPKGAYYTQLWLQYILSKLLAGRDGAAPEPSSSSSLCANTSDIMTSSSGSNDKKTFFALSKVQIRDLIVDFYMAIVEMKPIIDDDEEQLPPADLRIHFPETLILDKHRLLALGEKHLQLELVTAAIFITGNLAGKRVCETPKFKTTLKTELIVILNNVSWGSC